MQSFSIATPYHFFAAANGADGFRSYFDDIFPSEGFDGVFILKGGPGTGKSTLLKELAYELAKGDIQTEIFYCSSDPSSLDAVLFSKEEKRIAVLDGTAPHERDARIPGATDALFDLGIGFDKKLLRSQKKEIVDLQKRKSLAYKEAYFNLGVFGIFESKIEAELKKRLKKDSVKAWAEKEILPLLKGEKHSAFSPRLIRAFSREGVKRLDSYEKISEKVFAFCGDEAPCGIVVAEVLSVLRNLGYGGYYAPSPLMPKQIDAILLEGASLAITASSEDSEHALPCEIFFTPLPQDGEQALHKYHAEAERFLAMAKDALMRASEYHFSLERIYTPAMHFDRLAPFKEDLKNQIASLLSQ